MKLLGLILLFTFVENGFQAKLGSSDVIDLADLEQRLDPAIYELIHKLHTKNKALKAQNMELKEQNQLNEDLLKQMDSLEEQHKMLEAARRKRHDYSAGFAAYASLNKVYDVDLPVVFDVILINDGSYYANTTGTFVCPVDGYYYFSMNVRATAGTVLELQVAGEGKVSTYSDSAGGQGSNSMVVRCLQTQQVYVKNIAISTTVYGAEATDFAYSSFSGVLLFPDYL